MAYDLTNLCPHLGFVPRTNQREQYCPQKRPDEAWTIIQRMHHSSNDPDDRFARDEFRQMTVQVEADRVLYESESVWTLFTKLRYRKRVLCGFFTFFSTESSGILVIYSTFSFSASAARD